MTKRLLSFVIAALMVLALVPMNMFAANESKTVAPAAIDPPVTFSGAVIEQEDPQVGDTFMWPLVISEGSSFDTLDILVDYDENYLTCSGLFWDFATYQEEYPQLHLQIDGNEAALQSDDFSIVGSNLTYAGGTGGDPAGTSGNTYARFQALCVGSDYDGVQAGGNLCWLRFRWTAIPAAGQLPITIVPYKCCYAIDTYYTNVTADNDHSYVNVTSSTVVEPTTPPAEEDMLFYQIDSTEDLTDEYYVLVAPNDGTPKALNSTCTSQRMGASDVTVNDENVVVNPDADTIWWLEKQTNGTWTMFNEETGVYCYISRNNSSGYAVNADSSAYTYTIAFDADANVTMATNATGNRCISYYATNNDFRAYSQGAAERVPLYLYKYMEEAPQPTTMDVTFTGEEKNAGEVNVNDTLTWDLSVSENSGLYSGGFYVDYDETYLTVESVDTTFTGSVYALIQQDIAADTQDSDTPAFMTRLNYEATAEDHAKYDELVAGNMYSMVGMYLSSFGFGGVQKGGKLFRLNLKWVAVPEEGGEGVLTDETGSYLPMNTVLGGVYHADPTNNANKLEYDNITNIPGKIYFEEAEPEEYEVTFTGEEKDAGEAVEGAVFTWDLSVSEASGLVSGGFYVDQDERYLTVESVDTTFTGGVYALIQQDIAADTQDSDVPAFMSNINMTATAANAANIPGIVEGNVYSMVGLYLMSFDFGGLQKGGKLFRLNLKWTAVPEEGAEGVMTDETGTYLPMNTILSGVYHSDPANASSYINYTTINNIPGKIYFTVAQTATLTITYTYADGTTAADTYEQEYTVGDAYSVTSPVIEGYTADKPVVSGTIEGNVTVNVVYTPNMYTVTWIVDDEQTVEQYPYGAMPSHADPVKAPDAQYTYVFAGWSPAVTTVTGNATYTATWTQTVNTYTVTWVIDGVEETQTYEYGATPTHEDPVKAPDAQYTYVFAGWSPAVTTVTGNATYTATWTQTVNTYTVTWVIDGVEETQTYEYGATPTHEDPVKEGYTFVGWTPEIVEVTGNATYTAVFEENAPTGYHIYVTDYTNGVGTTSIDPEMLYNGEVTFTVTCDVACAVGIDNGNDSYTRLTCSTVNGEHTFKVTVTDADVYLVLVVRGDVTFDGRVKALDATRVNQAAVGNSSLTALQIFAADLNYDGVIKAIDATKVKQVAVGNQTYAW